MLPALTTLDPDRFESAEILKCLNATSRVLAELKGVAATIPNQSILINTLGLQEAKDSSEIESIITTHDELFRAEATSASGATAQTKEVLRYRTALYTGFADVLASGLLTNRNILLIQQTLEKNRAGFRRVPGTTLKNASGEVVYTPPSPELVPDLMSDLERFINDDALFESDPLIKMALIHYQFESIHPFYDGNGRTGRIINVLYLVRTGLLGIPVLYLSRQIVKTKADYYRLLQAVRDENAWEAWVLYMLQALQTTAAATIHTIGQIKTALQQVKQQIRKDHRFYSQDLINLLFMHPYTRIDQVKRELKVTRVTATKYLEALVADHLLIKIKLGRGNYYINRPLNDILTAPNMQRPHNG